MSIQNLIIFFFLFLIQKSTSQISNYMFRLEKGEKECLQDFFPAKTLVIYEIASNITLNKKIR